MADANKIIPGCTLYVLVEDLRMQADNTVPTAYGTLQCRVLLASDGSEEIGAVTMTRIGTTNDIECEIPAASTAGLTVGTRYRIEVSATVNTSRTLLYQEEIKASYN